MTPRAAEVSAFVTSDNLLQYTVMAFRLQNGPAAFQRLMNRVLAGIPDCDPYLDVFRLWFTLLTGNEHLKTLHMVFDRLHAKCEFGRATVTYFGKQVG